MANIGKKTMTRSISSRYFYGILAGTIFTLFGIIQCILFFDISSDISSLLFIPKDIIGGFILILIGIIFLTGSYQIRLGANEGVAFIYMGILLSLFFLFVYLLIILANMIEAYVLLNDEFIDWSPINDFRPGIYLSILTIIGFLFWHEKFSLQFIKRENEKSGEK